MPKTEIPLSTVVTKLSPGVSGASGVTPVADGSFSTGTASAISTVGLIGLGKMGMPIARNLLRRGFDVIGFRRSLSPDLAAAGGMQVPSVAAVAAAADVILSILPGTEDVREVVCGPGGTVSAMRPGVIHIEMSTIDVKEKQNIRDAVRRGGGDLLDCPISGSPGMIEPRLATTFVSGESASVEAVRSVLDAVSGPWVFTGPFGSGTRMKYIANLLLAAHTAAAAEAMAMAEVLGLDLELVQETLNDSIASSTIWQRRGPMMRERVWSQAPGPIDTLHPILEQIQEQATATGLDLPVFTSAKGVFDKAKANGWGDLDIASVYDQVTGRSPFPTE